MRKVADSTTDAQVDFEGRESIPAQLDELRFDGSADAPRDREIAIEAPVSIEVCGVGYAVMMATPTDLVDFGVGFALAEGFVEHASQIDTIEPWHIPGGWALRIWLPPERQARVFDRVRNRISESSCGLCGMENIEEVLRPLPPVTAAIRTSPKSLLQALESFRDHQPLGRSTGAVHAAAFCSPDGAIQIAREDVGRHNALDKLVGAMARGGIDPANGFILLSARCSYELVEKTVRAGCPMLVTISAPTSLAVERARAAGLTLVSLARADSALVVCDEGNMIGRG